MIDIDACVKCNLCTSNCPVVRVSSDFAGPKAVCSDMSRLNTGSRNPGALVDAGEEYCLLCRTCDLTCPAGFTPSQVIEEHRAEVRPKKGTLAQRLRDSLLSRPDLVGRVTSRTAPVANLAASSHLGAGVGALFGLDGSVKLPPFAKGTFADWLRDRERLNRRKNPVPERENMRSNNMRADNGRPVAYFYGCHVNYFNHGLGKKVIDVLESAGCQVHLPNQVCCGLPSLGIGQRDEAKNNALHNIRQFSKAIESGWPVVTSSTSCDLMIRSDYPRLLEDDPDLKSEMAMAEHLSAFTFDISEYLLELMESGQTELNFKLTPLRVVYHAGCHLRAHGVGLPALRLLSSVPGLEAIELDAGCCGMGGTYGFKSEKSQISRAIGEKLAKRVKSLQPDLIASDCEGCRMQLSTLCPDHKVVHPIELIHSALQTFPG